MNDERALIAELSASIATSKDRRARRTALKVWRVREDGMTRHHLAPAGKSKEPLCGAEMFGPVRRVRAASDTCNGCASVACIMHGTVDELTAPKKPRRRRKTAMERRQTCLKTS